MPYLDPAFSAGWKKGETSRMAAEKASLKAPANDKVIMAYLHSCLIPPA